VAWRGCFSICGQIEHVECGGDVLFIAVGYEPVTLINRNAIALQTRQYWSGLRWTGRTTAGVDLDRFKSGLLLGGGGT
jgi:hypothetical protein